MLLIATIYNTDSFGRKFRLKNNCKKETAFWLMMELHKESIRKKYRLQSKSYSQAPAWLGLDKSINNRLLKLSNLYERNVKDDVKILQFTTFKLSFYFSDYLRMNHCDFCARNKKNENSVTPGPKQLSKIDVDDTTIFKESVCKQQRDSSHVRNLLAHIDKTPIKCPVSKCSQLIGITSVMRHFLRDHRTRTPVDFIECYADERIRLRFNESMLRHNETVCLGVLAYGGIESEESSRPGRSGLALVNFMLPENYSQLINHMAITVLGRKLSLADLFKEDSCSNEATVNAFDDIVVIWLAAAETTRKVLCTVTAFNVSCSRSVIVEIQNLKLTKQKPFLDEKTEFLILNRGDINILSNNQQNSIDLEVSVQEMKSIQ